jgi:50S ribosomal subunit-associated GTPase HflX
LLGDTREIRKVFFETVTVKPAINTEVFDQKVLFIEQQKARNLSTFIEEHEIDKLIFEHYELTSFEISLIEESSSLSVVSNKSSNLLSSSVSI